MKGSRPLRVPKEFDNMLDRLATEISKETGYTKNKSAVMRKLAEANDKIIFKNNKIDWRVF